MIKKNNKNNWQVVTLFGNPSGEILNFDELVTMQLILLTLVEILNCDELETMRKRLFHFFSFRIQNKKK